YIQNTTSIDDLLKISRLLQTYRPHSQQPGALLQQLPKKPALGSLTSSYYTFLSSLQQWTNFKEDRLYERQLAGLKELLVQQKKNINNSKQRVRISRNNLRNAHKFYRRDSILYAEHVIAEAKLDQTQRSWLNGKSTYQSVYNMKIN